MLRAVQQRLGEPGIGKSTALNAERFDIEHRAERVGEKTFWIDLEAYQTDFLLVQETFRHPSLKKGWGMFLKNTPSSGVMILINHNPKGP